MLQKWIDVANDDQLKLISIALSKCFVDVARDKFGNHFCLKMMSSRAAQVINCQKGSIGLSQLMSNVATLAEHQHSSHVIQRIVEQQVWTQLSKETKIEIANAISSNLPRLARHKLGSHVARKAFSVVFGVGESWQDSIDKSIQIEDFDKKLDENENNESEPGEEEQDVVEILLKALDTSFLQLAIDQFGCRLFEACIRCDHSKLTECLVTNCVTNINRLARHTFGALSARAVINGMQGNDNKKEIHLRNICNALAQHAVSLARDRQGNLVLQAAIRGSAGLDKNGSLNFVKSEGESISSSIALKLLPHSVPLCLDWFGNRVIQRLLESLPRESKLFEQLTSRIVSQKEELSDSQYGKHVLKVIESGVFPAIGDNYEEIQTQEDYMRMGLPEELVGMQIVKKNLPGWQPDMNIPSAGGSYDGYDQESNTLDHHYVSYDEMNGRGGGRSGGRGSRHGGGRGGRGRRGGRDGRHNSNNRNARINISRKKGRNEPYTRMYDDSTRRMRGGRGKYHSQSRRTNDNAIIPGKFI